MLSIDYVRETRTITITGSEVRVLVEGTSSPFFRIALGMVEDGKNGLRLDKASEVQKKISAISGQLRKMGLRYQLSDNAIAELKERMRYLKAFDNATREGAIILESPPSEPRLPPTFVRHLKSFQFLSVNHMIAIQNAANFSVPGSGKTTMVLAAYSVMKETGEVDKILVVGPRAAFDPWTEEYQECFGKPPMVARICGFPEEREELFESARKYELFMCSYQMVANETEAISDLLSKNKMLLVIDESHHLKKGPGGKWFDAISEVLPYARRRIILSGTPAPNSISDLASQFEILWPDLNVVREVSSAVSMERRIEEARKSIRPLYTRVKKSDLKLPDPLAFVHNVVMGPAQARVYNALVHDLVSEIARDAGERALIRELKKAIIVRLLQSASNPALLSEKSVEFQLPPLSHVGVELDRLIKQYSKYEFPTKLNYAVDLARRIVEEGRKVIIWTSFVQNVAIISQKLDSLRIMNVQVTGLLPTEDEEENREHQLREFKQNDQVKVLVATMPSVGESVSLHKVCSDAIYVDRTFNCGLYMQSLDRIHRIGISNELRVNYHILCCRDTIDSAVNTRLNEKMLAMHELLNDDIGIMNLEAPDDISDEWDLEDFEIVLRQISSRIGTEGID